MRRDYMPIVKNPMLTGPHRLIDAPMTAEDWRVVYEAYFAFMVTVRRVASAAYERAGTKPPAG